MPLWTNTTDLWISIASRILRVVEFIELSKNARNLKQCHKTEWPRMTVAVSLRNLVIRIFIDFL